MTITEAIETAARSFDELIEQELADLAASGADDDVLAQARARLTARRTAILAELWTKLERDPPA